MTKLLKESEMPMTPTSKFIASLGSLKQGDLGILRTLSGKGLDESLAGFDLFTGIWWPLRQISPRAPRREIAWLIAKVFARYPITHCTKSHFAAQLGACQPKESIPRDRYRKRFDRLLELEFRQLEPALLWALDCLSSNNRDFDWVMLTDDLSIWDRRWIRLTWAEQFLRKS